MDDFTELSVDLGEAAVRVGARAAAVLRKSARDVEAHGKRRAPVDTGTMRASIGVDYEGDGRSARMSAEVGPTVHYAPHVEYGTARQAPQPFMRPAAAAVEPAFVEAMADIAGDIL